MICLLIGIKACRLNLKKIAILNMTDFHIYNWEQLLQQSHTYQHKDLQSGCYVGQLSPQGQRNGQGYFMFNDTKDFYIGDWAEDMMHGRGKMLYNFAGSYEIYEGQWMLGQHHGHGEYKLFDNVLKKEITVYKGTFSYGSYCGQGELNLLNGLSYIGSFDNSCPHGKGKLIRQTNDIAEVTMGYGLVQELREIIKPKKVKTVLIPTSIKELPPPKLGSMSKFSLKNIN